MGILLVICVKSTISKFKQIPISTERYIQIEQWQKDYPSIKPVVGKALSDDKINTQEYYDIQECYHKELSKKLKVKHENH